MKAEFTEKQPSVKTVTYDDLTRVFICANGRKITKKYDYDDVDHEVWEYDYHEFADETNNLDMDDINANPSRYLDYDPAHIVANQKALFAQYRDEVVLASLTDQQALSVCNLYPQWSDFIGDKLEKGNRVLYKAELWKVRQDIPSVIETQEPGESTASLYERIDEKHTGTKEDPIPYATTMTVYKDKYYLEDGIKYLCTRDSGQPLYAKCKDLIGNCFNVVED